MKSIFWKIVANDEFPTELHLAETAVLVYEVEVRARLDRGPFPSTVTLVRVEEDWETVLAQTRVCAPV